MPKSTLSEIEVAEILRRLDDLGATHALPEARDLRTRAAELRRRAREAPADVGAHRARLVRDLATGTADLKHAVDELADAHLAVERAESAANLLRAAADHCDTLGGRVVLKAGDDLIVDVLRPIVDEAVATASTAAADVPSIVHDADDAFAAGPAVAAAWQTISEAEAVRSKAATLARYLRDHGVAASSRHVARQDHHVLEYLHPDRAARVAPNTHPHPVRLFIDDLLAGAAPTLRPAAEVDEEVDAELAAAAGRAAAARAAAIDRAPVPADGDRVRAAVADAIEEDRRRATFV